MVGDLPAMAPAMPTGVPATDAGGCWAAYDDRLHASVEGCHATPVDESGLCPTHAVQLRRWPPDPDRARTLEANR